MLYTNRIQSLRRHWGDVDYAASYQLGAAVDSVFKLEKSLHFLLAEHALTLDVGDGKTEFFALAALDYALRHIELFAPGRIVKGIAKPVRLASTSRNTKERWLPRKMRRQSHAMMVSVSDAAKRFDRINRWLVVLLRRQSRVEYQWTIDDFGTVKFRFAGPYAARLDADDAALIRVVNMFQVDVRDVRGGWSFRSGATSWTSQGVVQFDVRYPTASDLPSSMNACDRLIAWPADQTRALLRKLPKRSDAAKEDIPVLDGKAIAERLCQRLDGDSRQPRLPDWRSSVTEDDY